MCVCVCVCLFEHYYVWSSRRFRIATAVAEITNEPKIIMHIILLLCRPKLKHNISNENVKLKHKKKIYLYYG